ncbi:hypothetical protein LD112_10025 [Pantoea agglomerans]|nr:hypothetical protein [Pantoea agglomerans]
MLLQPVNDGSVILGAGINLIHRAQRHRSGLLCQLAQFRQILSPWMARQPLRQPRLIARHRRFRFNLEPQLQRLFHARLFQSLLQQRTGLEPKPGVDQPDLTGGSLRDDVPDRLIGRAAQLPVTLAIDRRKSVHKRLFQAVERQHRPAKVL